MDDIFDEEGDEEEQDQIVNQVLGEIGIEMNEKMNSISNPGKIGSGSKQQGDDKDVDDLLAKLDALKS